jgi:tetratricopeptide (TPR) repeat protein
MLALVTLAVYLPVRHQGFLICDDDDYVTQNPPVEAGLTAEGIKWAFTTFHSANWHPLTWLSLMADCQFFGLNAEAFHLENALYHAANTALLFLLFWRLTGLILPAFFVASLFGWHPAHVESVAWVAERKDVLSTFFGLLALLSYATFARENSRRSYWLALLFFALSLLAKPMLVTLPFLLLLLDFWPMQKLSQKTLWPLVGEKIPFFVLTVVSCLVTYHAQHTGQAVVSLGSLPLHFRLEYPPAAALRYVFKLFWPADLAFFYPYRPIPPATVALALVALAVISVGAWAGSRLNRCWLFGWLWFLGTLVPVIGIVQVGGAAVADRYTYIPSIGLFTAVAFGLYAWPRVRSGYFMLVGLSLIGCVITTEKQLTYWRNSEALMRHTVAVTRDNEIGHFLLAAAFESDGQFVDAIAEYREALAINPGHYQFHHNIGNLLLKLGQPGPALAEYQQAVSGDPKDPIFHNGAGRALSVQGNFAAAQVEFAEAERLSPHDAEPHLRLAKNYFQQGMDEKAAEELRAAVRAAPDDFRTLVTAAHYLAANTNAAARDEHSGLILALQAKALAVYQQQAAVYDVLGMAFAAAGNFSDAVACAQKSLEYAPAAKLKDTSPMQLRLELYQKNQPWLESFATTNNTPVP